MLKLDTETVANTITQAGSRVNNIIIMIAHAGGVVT